jgi:FkbM family methyltransferase
VKEHNELSSGEIDFFNIIKDDIETVVDVGARTDTFYAKSPSKLGVNRSVFMFEANPAFAKKLASLTPSLGQSNFVFNIAIGKEHGHLHYFYDTQSFVKISNVGNVSKHKSIKPIEVRTLDSFSETISKIDFLKTDIEEMDFFALLGAKSTLPRIQYIQFELGLGMQYKGRTVQNSDYWDLLEPTFNLFILRDSNPVWNTYPNLPLLVTLDSNSKIIISILQSLGYGFNIVAINKKTRVSDALSRSIGHISDLNQNHGGLQS